jgi:hypothetical protein
MKVAVEGVDEDVFNFIKERAMLAELSRNVSAKGSVEKIREALHEKASESLLISGGNR